MKQRVAIYTAATPEGGGTYQYAISLLTALSRLNRDAFELTFWCTSPVWLPIAEKLCIPARLLASPPSLPARGIFRLARGLTGVLGKQNKHLTPYFFPIYLWRPDICVALHQSYTPLPHCRIIGPIHDLMHRYEARFAEVGELSIYRAREELFSGHCANASAILVDSEVGKQHVMEIYSPPEDRIFVLPFVPSPLADCAVRPQDFPLADGRPYIFYPAQLWRHKNHENLLRAVHRLLPAYADMQCIFTGSTDKNGFPVYDRLVRELDLSRHVHHLGYVSDREVRWLYEHARFMAMPSFFGPTNIPPLEAMQAGCPVAVSDIYGMRERYGEAALYFDPRSVQSIADAIETLWTSDELREDLRQKGREQVARWTSADFEREFMRIFLQVAAQ